MTNPIINKAVICLRADTCKSNTSTGAFEDINYFDGGQYGSIFGESFSNYTFQIDFNNLGLFIPLRSTSTSQAFETNSSFVGATAVSADNRRDVVLSFVGHLDRDVSTSFQVYINGVLRADTGRFNYNKSFKLVLNRNFFRAGTNSIRINRHSSSAVKWGISNIQASFNPVVPITVGQNKTTLYGYNQSPARYTGLRVSVNLPSTIEDDYAFYAKGWDIDTATETQVFLNGNSIGYLPTSPSSAYAPTERFLLKKEDLQGGVNLIEFQQRFPGAGWSGIESEKWAVKDLLIEVAKPASIVPILQLLLLDE